MPRFGRKTKNRVTASSSTQTPDREIAEIFQASIFVGLFACEQDTPTTPVLGRADVANPVGHLGQLPAALGAPEAGGHGAPDDGGPLHEEGQLHVPHWFIRDTPTSEPLPTCTFVNSSKHVIRLGGQPFTMSDVISAPTPSILSIPKQGGQRHWTAK